MPQQAQSKADPFTEGLLKVSSKSSSASTPRVQGPPPVGGAAGFGLGMLKGAANMVAGPVAALAPIGNRLRGEVMEPLQPHGTAQEIGSYVPMAAGVLASGAADLPATVAGLGGGFVGGLGGRILGPKIGLSPQRGEAIGGMLGGLAGAAEGPEALGKVKVAGRDFVVEHPSLTRAGAEIGGMGAGAMLGEHAGGMNEGFGGFGGLFAGRYIGNEAVRAAEDSAVDDVLTGQKPLETLPKRLWGKVAQLARNMENAKGEPMEQSEIPSGVRRWAENYTEQRAREATDLGRVILTPEEMNELKQRNLVAETQAQEMKPGARVRGMAEAAGSHHTEWVPSKRGVRVGEQTLSRFRPKIPLLPKE